MSDSPYILEATHASFPEQVLENSRRLPVLVDFWAAWCQPCQMLSVSPVGVRDRGAGEILA